MDNEYVICGPKQWLIAHSILPTADCLLRFGMQVNPLCHCGRTESLIHLLIECPFAIQLIDWYFSIGHKRFRPQFQRPFKSDLPVGYGKNVKVYLPYFHVCWELFATTFGKPGIKPDLIR